MTFKGFLKLWSSWIVSLASLSQPCISGRVYDNVGEPAIGAIVRIYPDSIVLQTDINGQFKACPQTIRNLTIEITYFGTRKSIIIPKLSNDTTLEIKIIPQVNLNPVTIIHKHSLSIEPGGITKISMQELSRRPALLGIREPITQLKSIGGVTTVSETQEGLAVRGTAPEHTLILLDGVPLYFPGRVFGMFSMLHPEIVKDITFYPGAFPAKYGGRLGAIAEFSLKTGEWTRKHLSFWTGTATTGLYLSAPITKNVFNVTTALRYSYLGRLIKAIHKTPLTADFGDAFLQLAFRHKDKTVVRFWTLTASDWYYQSIRNDSTVGSVVNPGIASALSIRHKINKEAIIKSTFYYYNNSSEVFYRKIYDDGRLLAISTGTYHFSAGLNTILTHRNTELGLQLERLWIRPLTEQVTFYQPTFSDTLKFESKSQLYHAWHKAVFVSHAFDIRKFSIVSGIRANYFTQIGPYSRPRSDTFVFRTNEIVASYFAILPRLRVTYTDTPFQLVLASGFAWQPVHKLSQGLVTTPWDFWLPSTVNVKPSYIYDLTPGIKFIKNNLAIGIDLFYRLLWNLYEFKQDYVPAPGVVSETELTRGTGKAYGIVVYFLYENKRLSLNGNYTYSRSWRFFPTLNQGIPFPADEDRPHVGNLTASYTFIDRPKGKWTFSLKFVIASGKLLTLPSYWLISATKLKTAFFWRNNYRLPTYHRLDLSVSWQKSLGHRSDLEVSFTLYNAYNRQNIHQLVIDEKGRFIATGRYLRTEAYTLFPIMPAITVKLDLR
ncbi:MAG: TonB-dependent receptor plug domain-containing protein [Chlorobi bacterium]|nr:TonB-dependent receptor plug domain-containing protein [Chlorobiota bacterium]